MLNLNKRGMICIDSPLPQILYFHSVQCFSSERHYSKLSVPNKMCIPTPAGSVNCMYSLLALTQIQQNLRSRKCINVLLLFVPSVWCSSKCPSSICYCPDSWKPQQHKHQHLLGSSPSRSPKWSHPGVQGRKDLYWEGCVFKEKACLN